MNVERPTENHNQSAQTRVQAPPIRVWMIAAVISSLLMGGFHLVAHQVTLPTMEFYQNYNRLRIAEFAELSRQHPEKKVVVALGNSTMKYGTNVDRTTATFSYDENILVLRLVNVWANFSDFAPLTDEILSLKPDLILMQADLLGRVRVYQRISKTTLLQSYLKWKLSATGDWNPESTDMEYLLWDQTDYDDQSESRFHRRNQAVREWQIVDLESQDALAASEFVKRASDDSIHVALLFTPVTSRAETLQEDLKQQLAPAVEKLVRRPLVNQIEFPGSITDQNFSDFVHMNAEGRTIFERWLVPELRRLMSEN